MPVRAPVERRTQAPEVGAQLPRDLARFLALLDRRTLGEFVPASAQARSSGRGAAARRSNTFERLVAGSAKTKTARARLYAWLAGAAPIGVSRKRALYVYLLAESSSPAHGVIAALDPAALARPRLVCRGASTFALVCALDERAPREAPGATDASKERAIAANLGPGIAAQEAVDAAFARAQTVLDLLLGDDADIRRAARRLALRSLDVPPPPETSRRGSVRTAPLALGPLVEAFFREGDGIRPHLQAHRRSPDTIVRDAAAVLEEALDASESRASKTRPTTRTARPASRLARELARRRDLALRASRRADASGAANGPERLERLVAQIDAFPPVQDPTTPNEARDEALLALAELGDHAVMPSLVARAVIGDVAAVDMLAALGDRRAIPDLVGILEREPARYRQLEGAVARALAALDARSARPILRKLLVANPMPSWREGIERGGLVRELVLALGTLEDTAAGPALLDVLEARNQEYRAVLPGAAWALGRIRHEAALPALDALLHSPQETVSCEAIWAVGTIGEGHAEARARAASVLRSLPALEPGAEVVRLTALAKLDAGASSTSFATLRAALERALWEPAFRREETSRRRVWALRCLTELRSVHRGVLAHRARPRARAPARASAEPFFLGYEAVRYFVTRDDHRVRRAAEEAFAAWEVPLPTTRRYLAFVLPELERLGGLDALHDAVRDPLGVFRHNVATRLAELRHPTSVRPLAEATARLFAEPPTSTYEYDDAPASLVAFVRALASFNQREGNDVLIEGLASGNHQVRAVIAENAPDDARFVPQLMAMLGDPRSFLRSRAERSLAALGVHLAGPPEPSPSRAIQL